MSIYLSINIQTSPNNHLLLAICGHFTDSQEKLINALLGLYTVASYSKDKQQNTLLPVLEDYGITQKLGAVISDNYTTNNKLCRIISDQLFQKEGIKQNPVYQRIRYQGHILNLTVQAFLFKNLISLNNIKSYEEDKVKGKELDPKEEKEKSNTFRKLGALRKLYNITIHTRSLASRIREFKSLIGRRIPLNNCTRQNSQYFMLSVAIKKKSTLNTYTKRNLNTLKKDYLSPKDWEALRIIKSFLQIFYQATLKC